MVAGFKSFKEWFRGYENEYVIIGGAACDLIMGEEDMTFRATKDIDMVLIVEALTAEFGKKFWSYVREAGYEHQNKSTGEPQFYRFSHPRSKSYPTMIELFSRQLDAFNFHENTQLTPIPIDDDISSLSAILLNEEYYQFLRRGQIVIDGIPVLRPEYLIPFKAKAWLDLTSCKKNGEHVDSKNIRKHKNDVFRLSVFITEKSKIELSTEIREDMICFLEAMYSEVIDLKSLGVPGLSLDELIGLLKSCYL